MTWLRSLLFAVFFYAGTVFYVLAGIAAWPVSRSALMAVVGGWAHFHFWCARILLGIRIQVEGSFDAGPVIYAVKHESMFETVDLVRLMDTPAMVAKEELFSIPLWGKLLGLYGMIPVAREEGGRAVRAMLAAARKAHAQGRSIVIFPEGTRITHGERPPLKPGVLGLYRMLNLPMVPVAVDSGRLCPRGSFVKHSGVIRYRIGETIPPGLDRNEAMRRLHLAINALNA